MEKSHKLLTKGELAKRWGKDYKTINKWIAEKKIKTFRGTDLFPLDYVESLEKENIDMDTVSAFALRAKDREFERLKKENAMLKGQLLQITILAAEGTRNLVEDRAI